MIRRATLGLLGALLLGCGGLVDVVADRAGDAIAEELAEQLIEQSIGGDLEVNDDGSITLTADGMVVKTGNQEVPEDFPLAIPDAVQVVGVTDMTRDGERSVGVMVAMQQDVDVLALVEGFAGEQGWTESTREVSDAGGVTLTMVILEKDAQKLTISHQASDDRAGGMWTWSRPL